jgi:tRNA A-37 threonylcarbamoyl transferase component Bud32
VPTVASFGFAGSRLRLECLRVPGIPLARALPELSRGSRARLGRALIETASQWHRLGFVHGDLSPRNILVTRPASSSCSWFIDWVVDPTTFEATPAFSAPGLLGDQRSCASDSYAIKRILCILDPR